MSGLPSRGDDVDVREQGSALRVATNTPHLVSLGTGRLSTAVTLHPIKQGRVTIGSDPTCDIYVVGTGVANVHCRVENSHDVVTLYPISGTTLLDGLPVDKPTRLSQGSMLTIGRSNYLRFNHPEEALLMKSVLPAGHVSMAPAQFTPNEACEPTGYVNHQFENHCYQEKYKDNTLMQLDQELDLTLKSMSKRKPPVAPRKPYKEDTDSNSDQESRPKIGSIMAKVSKFEYYAKQQKVGKSQFFTNDLEISPKVFSANSLTVNTPAKDVLGGRNVPNYMKVKQDPKMIVLENNLETKVQQRNKTKIDDLVRNFDDREKLPKKVNNDVNDFKSDDYGKICAHVGKMVCLASPTYAGQYSPVYSNLDRSKEAESMRIKAYQDRVKEEEQKEAETARLEEILNMCAEYEKQITSGVPLTPPEKRPHNKIITNGSLPRSVTLTHNLVQTNDGYYKFDTSLNKSCSQSLPVHSTYENYDTTPEVKINDYENIGRMDEIGIPYEKETSPAVNRKMSPIGSPYENMYFKNSFKPKSPNTHSPRTRIKTTFAHKNLPSPQYFIFPPPPQKEDNEGDKSKERSRDTEAEKVKDRNQSDKDKERYNLDDYAKETKDASKSKVKNTENVKAEATYDGIEKQLSIEEDIPMIDDSDISNDLELRYSKDFSEKEEKVIENNLSFDEVKKELMADIPELEEFERDIKERKTKKIEQKIEEVSIDSVLDDNLDEMKSRYEKLKEERRKLVSEIHELKCKMTEIRSQEDDILRELEMEKALIKGEYDSEIAILNIEQKKRTELSERARQIEDEIRQMRERQETRQNEMRDRVEIATLKVERIERDMKQRAATVEELQNAQDILDNETKLYEDLEFQHLEEESELLANREDLQNEITLLTKKIEAQKTRILTLKSEANNNLTSALGETKVLHAEYVKLLNQVETLTGKVQMVEKELRPIVNKLNDVERTQSPDSAFYTDQTRAKSGEFGYSPQSSDSDDLDLAKIKLEDQTKIINDKFNSIDQMSQSMIVDIERKEFDSPSKVKEKKGFWERNFDSLKRKGKDKKKPEKIDIMSQSLNENIFYNDNIEVDTTMDRFNSLRNSKKKDKKENGPIKSNSSSKIPTFAALGKIIKKDSIKRNKETTKDTKEDDAKNRYVKNTIPIATENKYVKAKSLSPDKSNSIKEEDELKNINVTDDVKLTERNVKIRHRKSCGDEPSVKIGDLKKITDSNKIPSQDDIDRISKVTMDAPILSSDTDMSSLGKRTLDSLMEIERKRMEMLEEQGCQVIENEREKISELKKRAQDETKKLWDQRNRDRSDSCQLSPVDRSPVEFDRCQVDSRQFDRCQLDSPREYVEDASYLDGSYVMTNSTIYEDSSGFLSSSIEELQVRNSQTESTEDDKRSDDSRPLSHASDFSRDNMLSLASGPRRSRRTVPMEQRPLTRYLPVDRDDFDLRRHVECAGHQVDLCPYVTVTASACRGYLHKLGAKFHTWSKRWFVFDRESKTFVYYWDKSEKKPRGGAYFQVIEEVYLDHGNTSKSPNPQTTFIVKTRQRRYYLMAPSGEAARIWIDVIFTGAQGYTEYLE
ncbi:pleckstrin homology-like domain family B member 2 [Aricia agestis]|uniref:pleckstrin homology-like domain family B member 2 n=1 Tax=Aricia agestis TaxID=91739 RepID=UPI001C204F5B|nr:pleckstrin homology-like domain family B member 2 [Aricia agestis]